MLNEAISKIQTEMEKEKDNSYVQVVGDFLLRHLNIDPAAAERILDKDKNISKSLDAMKKEARKKQKGGCAVLSDAEGFAKKSNFPSASRYASKRV